MGLLAKCCPENVLQTLKTNIKIIKSILSRCLYALYLVFAAWRVVVSWDNPKLWFLLLSLLPLMIETMVMAFKQKGNEFKWMSPGVMIYLMGAIPCIWFWEIKTHETTLRGLSSSNITSCDSVLGVCLANEAWTLALEQAILLILIVGKWIAPKGQMSQDELSQLLLVYLGTGGDIMGMLDLTRNEQIRTLPNPLAIYIVLSVWSWSLLQFSFVTTATKDMPKIFGKAGEQPDEGQFEEVREEEDQEENPTADTQGATRKKTIQKETPSHNTSACCLPCRYDNQIFCFHNEIWGLAVGLLFQDIPFLAVRLVMMIMFGAVSNTTIFFAFKNGFVIILLLNRIRAVVVGQKYKWLKIMKESRRQRALGITQKHHTNRMHNMSEFTVKKPKWLIWRA